MTAEEGTPNACATDAPGPRAPSSENPEIELARRKMEHDAWYAAEQIRLGECELELKRKGSSWRDSRLTMALVAAAIAGLVNAWVANINSTTQIDIALKRQAHEKSLEKDKVDAARISEALKLEPNAALRRLQMLVDYGLISDYSVARLDRLREFLNLKQSGPGAYEAFPWESAWLGGGQNADEVCEQERAALHERFTGREITTASFAEESRKDFFGHVKFKYRCVFRLSRS